jgi:hypothetical protein
MLLFSKYHACAAVHLDRNQIRSNELTTCTNAATHLVRPKSSDVISNDFNIDVISTPIPWQK